MFCFCIFFALIESYMQILGTQLEFFFPYLLAHCISTGEKEVDFTVEEGAAYSFLCGNFLFAC